MKTGSGSRVSSLIRLRAFPAVFRGSELTVRCGFTSQVASVYLNNWRKQGLVKSLGGHSDVHFNLVVEPDANLEVGLRTAVPRAIKVGADILREAGWTTQIIRKPEIAAPVFSPLYDLDDFTMSARSNLWFERVGTAGIVDGSQGVRRLRPAYALADMIARSGDRRVSKPWLLAPDDLDFDAIAMDRLAPRALAAFNLSDEVFTQWGYGRVYDALNVRMRAARHASGEGKNQAAAPDVESCRRNAER